MEQRLLEGHGGRIVAGFVLGSLPLQVTGPLLIFLKGTVPFWFLIVLNVLAAAVFLTVLITAASTTRCGECGRRLRGKNDAEGTSRFPCRDCDILWVWRSQQSR